jgi:GMP synthase PP-ATPase subunit
MEPSLSSLGERFGLHLTPLPIRSVGVKADLRAYEHPVLVTGEAPWDVLTEAASAIMSGVPGINRCLWNLGPRVGGDPSPVPARVTSDRLDVLREADHLVMEALRAHDLYDAIWQCPTVLVPIQLTEEPGETVVVRPVTSERAMTARPFPLPEPLLQELRTRILSLPEVSGLALDITSKPPGTIEWE